LQLHAFVAQWIEQEPSNLLVAGSIPAEGASSQRFKNPNRLPLFDGF
jgi:hypothetical protein